MYRLIVLIVAFNLSAAYAITPVVETDPVNGRAETIRNLDINGALYNVSFDHAFGSDVFEGDAVGANAAIDAIVSELNTGYDNVDNSHPLLVAVFVVTFEDATNSGYAACRSIYIPECDDGDWANVGDLNTHFKNISAIARAYFEPVKQVTIDVLPGDAANKVYPNKGGQLPVAILSAADFDATQVDPATLRFGSAEALLAGTVTYPDVDGASGYDVLGKFKVQEAGIFCNDTEVSLAGESLAGEPFAGIDSIDATACESGGCHAY